MHPAFLCWQRDRRRNLQRYFASLGPFGGFGRAPPIPSDAAGKTQDSGGKDEKDSKEKAGSSDEDKEGKPSLVALLKEKKEKAERKEEKPPAARIVAYSDSEGEDEPFRLTRRRKKKAQGGEAAEAEKDEAPSTSSPAAVVMPAATQIARGQHQMFRAARAVTGRGATKISKELGWGALLQLVLLWIGRRWHRRAVQRFELLSLSISLPDALACLMGQHYPTTRAPPRLQALLHFAESWALPAAMLELAALLRSLPRRQRRRRMLTTISQSVRVFQEAELDAPSPSSRPLPRSQPRLAAEAAALHKVELAEMKRILQTQNVRLPAERFDDTNAELLRFATCAGLLQAESAEEKAHAIQEGAQRVIKTLDWLRRQRFMPAAQLKEWHHIVRWQGTDSEGLPILVIKAAKACSECQGEAGDSVAQAVLSQMQRAVTEVFSNRHGPDKMVVVVDAAGTDSLQAARNAALLKQVAVALNKHYPHRLHQLYLVDLPSQLRWVLATIKPLLHPVTKEKIRTVSNSDPALPLPPHLLHSPRADTASAEEGRDSSETNRARRISIPELPVSSSPAVGGGARRSSIPALPSAEEAKPRRRVRILDLPYREPPAQPANSTPLPGEGEYTPGSVLRPALKRSQSAGLIGIRLRLEGEEAGREDPGKQDLS